MRKFLLSLVALVAVAISASAKIVPSYTAEGTVGEYSYWSTTTWMSATPFSTNDAKVEMYKDSVVVRSWCGVEGYDISITLDADGNPLKLYQIVDGEATNSTSGGYQYANTGLTGDGSVAAVAAYITGGYGFVWADQENDGGITFMCYTYSDENCKNQIGCTYYYVGWDVPKPTFTAKGTVGEYDSWASYYTTPFSLEDVTVEVYTDSMVVRGWCGVEGYDIAVTTDADGNVAHLYQIVNEEVTLSASSAYHYANTGLTGDGDIATVCGYIGTNYSYAWVNEEDNGGGILMYTYHYGDTECKNYLSSGYYYISWDDEDTTGIGKTVVTKAVEEDGATYNVAGQKVGKSYKGLVIKNGKKFIQR